MKHKWKLNDWGECEIDTFAYESGFCNGPICEVCGFYFCEHCSPKKWEDDSCPGESVSNIERAINYFKAEKPEYTEPHQTYCDTAIQALQAQQESSQARPLEEWHEDYGDVLWWKFPVEEPPYCGSPLCCDWSDGYTHWTPIAMPSEPGKDEEK